MNIVGELTKVWDRKKGKDVHKRIYIDGILDIIVRYLERALKHDLRVILLTQLTII